MTVRRRIVLVVLAAVLVVGVGSPAFAVTSPPKSAQMRLRGVSFVSVNNGWAVGEGILATKDGGKTWCRQFAPVERRLNAVDMGTTLQGCAVGDRGLILRTADGGATWTKSASGIELPLYDLQDVDFVDGQYGWAVGRYHTVLRTTDGGATWTQCTLPRSTPDFPNRAILGVSFVDRLHGWVCGESVVGGDGFYDLYIARTSDGGATWTRCSNGPNQSGGGDDFWEYSSIDFVSATTGWVSGYTPGVHKTTNGATSWIKQGGLIGMTGIDLFNASVGVGVDDREGTAYYTTSGGAIWKKSNLDVSSGDILDPIGLGEVCMSSSTQAWTVAENSPWGDQSPEGLIAHSTDGGAHWTTKPSSTGPVFFLGGDTRYDSAVNIAKLTDAPAGTVILATGRDYPDALAASGLAGVMDATLLLTNNTLPSAVSKAIADLGANKVIIVGGADVVSNSIRDALAKKYTVERIGGVNRYETAANIARRMVAEGASPDEVFICCGTNYADAASASSLSYGRQIPILLVKPGELPYPTKRVLGELGSTDAYVVGSSVAVGNPVMRAIESAWPHPQPMPCVSPTV